MNGRERGIQTGNEGISPELRAHAATMAEVNAQSGVQTQCIIAYGSRARGTGRPDSDLDILVLVNYPEGNHTVQNKILERAKHGGVSIEIPTPKAVIHAMFVDTKQTIRYLRALSPLLSHHKFIKSIATDATVLYGEEPLVGKKQIPLIEYARRKAKIQK